MKKDDELIQGYLSAAEIEVHKRVTAVSDKFMRQGTIRSTPATSSMLIELRDALAESVDKLIGVYSEKRMSKKEREAFRYRVEQFVKNTYEKERAYALRGTPDLNINDDTFLGKAQFSLKSGLVMLAKKSKVHIDWKWWIGTAIAVIGLVATFIFANK